MLMELYCLLNPYFFFFIVYIPRTTAQLINNKPTIEIKLIEYLSFKTTFPVILLFRNKNPDISAAIANPVVAGFVLNQSNVFLIFPILFFYYFFGV